MALTLPTDAAPQFLFLNPCINVRNNIFDAQPINIRRAKMVFRIFFFGGGGGEGGAE